ncbi:MAG: caspase family protein [Deltaproteobacteria bacterium]|nr:caspase family protein [Deltaproteobacteria bacterium]
MIATLVSLALYAQAPSSGGALFDADKTFTVIAGVLEWKDPTLAKFSKVHRKDEELDGVLGKRGVASSRRTLLLDAAATTAAIRAALEKAIAAAGPGATLVFYYAGHGIQRAGGNIIFASYDVSAGEAEKTGLVLKELVPLFVDGAKKRFKGKRVILFADCCYSGGLGAVAKSLNAAGIDAVALTSADDSNTSTGNWTFSQTLIDALNGRSICDRNDDGKITLQELASEVKDAMKNREQQRFGYTIGGVSEGAIVADAVKETLPYPAGSGEYARRNWVQAPHAGKGGRNAVARILATKQSGDDVFVSFYDYSDESKDWVPKARANPVKLETYGIGTRLDVTWNGVVYEAEVVKVEDDFHYVTYPGWGHEWDEWVGGARIVGVRGKDAKPRGKPVKVEWGGTWWDAVLKNEQGGKYCVHYVGYDDSWDECVVASRLRQ